MNYKVMILAPSCGGKSSLMRYLREHTNLSIAETDEEIMNANNNIWPDDDLKNKVLVPKTTREIIARDKVVYFASYIPTELLHEAKEKGFMIAVLGIPRDELIRRNNKRMLEEGYDDVSPWFDGQIANFKELTEQSLVDVDINGNQKIEEVAEKIQVLIKA